MPISWREYSKQVIDNNHWNLTTNIEVGPKYIDPHAAPVAIPRHIGEPSLIKYVFLIIKENRTYDQMLGDVPWGNGDPSLAVFASALPNQHALVKRFPLLDNVYAPSRQSADGHPWIGMSGSFYSNDILVTGLDSFLSGRRFRRSSDLHAERIFVDRRGSQGTFGQTVRRMEQRRHDCQKAGRQGLYLERFLQHRAMQGRQGACTPAASFLTTRSA